MKVSQCMSRDVQVCAPDSTIQAAADTMQTIDSGVLPVGENDRLVGMITDRDIAVRAVARGLGPDTPVREVMTDEVCYVYDDQEIDDVAANMADQQVRRMPVVNRDKRLVGIISLGDISRAGDGRLDSGRADGDQAAARALSGISEPSSLHSQ